MHLEIEDIDDFYTMFSGKETDTIVFVGQLNYRSETSMSVDVVISTRYVDDGELTIISYKEPVGVVELPDKMYDRPETKHIFDEQQKKLESLDTEAEAKKVSMIDAFQKKGFTVYRGIWLHEG